jgi:beta-phosphoglucomutase-like phosphatase (HAD superfamily)
MKRSTARIRAILFDWAGTTADHGSRAPVEVFLEVFRRAGTDVSVAEVRGPMGMAKRVHLAAILALPRVVQVWRARHGRPPSDGDLDRLYALSEVSYLHAERENDRSSFLASAIYAYAFLVRESGEERVRVADPRSRRAGDLYERGLTRGPERLRSVVRLRG